LEEGDDEDEAAMTKKKKVTKMEMTNMMRR
jgi:hypothetical protein